MALDAICLQSVVRELKSQIVGARIEKIQQPRATRSSCCCAGHGGCLYAPGWVSRDCT